jgi:apolipoprotein N-acyltransferase
LCAALFTVSLVFGAYRVNRHDEPQKIIRAALIQQNIDTWLTNDAESIAVSQRLTERAVADGISRTGFKPDLCLWSESVLTWPMPEAAERYRKPLKGAGESLSGFITRMGFPFLVGGAVSFDAAGGKYGNATLFFDKDGEYKDYYAKMHLVPFAEVLPYTDIPLVKKFFDSVLGFSEAWTPGEKSTLFEIPIRERDGSDGGKTVKFVSPICFEDAFGYVCRELFSQGSELFVNLTNDSWSLTKSAEYQHYAIASYRAIEFRTTLARSTNSGYSAVIDPRGIVIADMPLFSEEYLFAEIPVYERVVTVFARADIFMYAVILLALLMCVSIKKTFV